MATMVRPVISEKSKYYIDKHRYYELKHFCLQYPMWKNSYLSLDDNCMQVSKVDNNVYGNQPGDPTSNCAILKAYYAEKIDMLEHIALEADEYLHEYILKAVTEGLSFTHLKTKLDIPCGRDMYYDRYRKFFWLLHRARD